jgi:hypothetical protein
MNQSNLQEDIIIKLQKSKTQRISKATRAKQLIMYKETFIWLSADFSAEIAGK